MASKSSLEDIEKRIVEVLKHLQPTDDDRRESDHKLFTDCDIKNPSEVAHLMGPRVRLDRNSDLISYFSLWLI